jgi:phosphatidate cytidylyltransferase
MNQNLKLRILTALVGIPVILFLLLGLGIEGVAFLSWVISMGMMYEFCRMFFKLKDARSKTLLALVATSLIHAFNYVISVGLSSAFLGLAPLLVFFTFFLFMVPSVLNYGGKDALNSPEGIAALREHVNELMALCFGFVYCVWFPMLMVTIRDFGSGKHWLMLCLLVIWSSDSFAYFAGRFFGKRRLYEVVSPKKTWEGAFGGALGALLVAGTYAKIYLPFESPIYIGVMILTLSAAGVVGDLAESLLKRAADQKDSGSILPGHGGFLDRFDGVVFALPVIYGFLRFWA